MDVREESRAEGVNEIRLLPGITRRQIFERFGSKEGKINELEKLFMDEEVTECGERILNAAIGASQGGNQTLPPEMLPLLP